MNMLFRGTRKDNHRMMSCCDSIEVTKNKIFLTDEFGKFEVEPITIGVSSMELQDAECRNIYSGDYLKIIFKDTHTTLGVVFYENCSLKVRYNDKNGDTIIEYLEQFLQTSSLLQTKIFIVGNTVQGIDECLIDKI